MRDVLPGNPNPNPDPDPDPDPDPNSNPNPSPNLGLVRDVLPVLGRELVAAALDARIHLVVRLAWVGLG